MLVVNIGISPTTETTPEHQSIGLITQVRDDMNMDVGLNDGPLCVCTHIGANLQTFLCPAHGFKGTISCPFWKEIPKSLAQICCCANMEQACVYRPSHPSIQAYRSASWYLDVQNSPLTTVRGLAVHKHFLIFLLLLSICKRCRTWHRRQSSSACETSPKNSKSHNDSSGEGPGQLLPHVFSQT